MNNDNDDGDVLSCHALSTKGHHDNVVGKVLDGLNHVLWQLHGSWVHKGKKAARTDSAAGASVFWIR